MTAELELLAAWRAGDVTAGSRLIAQYFALVFGWFARRVDEDVEALTQRTFRACVEHVDRLRELTSFRALLFGVARQEWLEHMRRSGQKPLHVDEWSDVAIERTLSGAAALRAEQRRLLVAVQRLSPQLRGVLELHDWDDLTTQEAADVLDIPVGTVRWRLGQARDKLRVALDASSAAPSDDEVEAAVRALRHGLGQ